MGLWYYAAGSVIPILNVLKNTTALQEDRIGIWLQSTRPHGKTNETATALGNYSAGGEITFGGVDASKFQGNFTYVDCVGLRPWTIPVGGVKVAGNNIKVDGAVAAIDTGTTAMLIPRTIADSINGAIPGAIKVATQGGTWYMPCNGNTDIVITFGNFSAKIPYSHVALQAARSKTQQGDYCLSAIMFPIGKTLAIQEWLIGDVFLKNVYSVFDFGTNASSGGRIGFAHLATEDMNSAISRMTRGSLVHLAVFVVLSTVYLLL
ncbi:hypothetical protein FBU30_001193 [Linnemannia zychae]|nr:hypothetical protein FBU30_001193 [Linnemannia zychae]